jgi:hypothetical protein
MEQSVGSPIQSISALSPRVVSPVLPFSNVGSSPSGSVSSRVVSPVLPFSNVGSSPSGSVSSRVVSPVATSPRVVSPVLPFSNVGSSPSGSVSPRVVSPVATSPRVVSPVATSPRVVSPVATSPRVVSPVATSPRVVSPVATSPRVVSPVATSPRVVSPVATSPRVVSPQRQTIGLPSLPAVSVDPSQAAKLPRLPTISGAQMPSLPTISPIVPSQPSVTRPTLPVVSPISSTSSQPSVTRPTLPTLPTQPSQPSVTRPTLPTLPTQPSVTRPTLPTLPTQPSVTRPTLPVVSPISSASQQDEVLERPTLPVAPSSTAQQRVALPDLATLQSQGTTTQLGTLPVVSLVQRQAPTAAVATQMLPTAGTITVASPQRDASRQWTVPRLADTQQRTAASPPKAVLPMKTDLSSLNQVRRSLSDSQELNPQAAFQQRRLAPQPSLSPIARASTSTTRVPLQQRLATQGRTLPTQSGMSVSPMRQALPTQSGMSVSPMRQALPTPVLPVQPTFSGMRQTPGFVQPGLGMQTQTARTVTAPVVSPGMVRTINLPKFNTTMQQTPLTRPAITPGLGFPQQQGLTVAYTPEQQAVQMTSGIDINRINPERARKGDNSYTHQELKHIGQQLGLKVSGTKRDLAYSIINRLSHGN